MTPAELSRTVLHAVRCAVADGALHAPVPESVSVERPRPGGCGDYATNVALRLAGPAHQPPRAVAEALKVRIAGTPGIAGIEITGPGFLNITLQGSAQQELVARVLEQGARYGHSRDLAGVAVRFEPADELRARVWTEAIEALLRSQGAEAGHTLTGHGDAEPLHVVPAPEYAGTGGVESVHFETGHTQTGHGDAEPLHVVPAPEYAQTGRVQTGRVEIEHVETERTASGPSDTAPLPLAPPPVPPDAIRWALLSAAAHDRPRVGPHLLVQHETNPLFTIRYAHSRARALGRNAQQLGMASGSEQHIDAPALTTAIADHPAVLASAARLRAPDRLARHLEATAEALLAFQHTVLPLGDEKPSAAHRSRLALAEAAGTVLAGGLSLLGISAPDYL